MIYFLIYFFVSLGAYSHMIGGVQTLEEVVEFLYFNVYAIVYFIVLVVLFIILFPILIILLFILGVIEIFDIMIKGIKYLVK